MLKYQAEKNWDNNVHELSGKYNLPLNDENVCNLTNAMWKKTCVLSYDKLIKAPYLTTIKQEIARMVFRARVGIYDIKENFKKKYDGKLSFPFRKQSPEQFEHIFSCNSGILCKGTTLYEFVTMKDMQKTKEIGKFLVTYQMYRGILLF